MISNLQYRLIANPTPLAAHGLDWAEFVSNL